MAAVDLVVYYADRVVMTEAMTWAPMSPSWG